METDHEELHRELENRGDEMQGRRDELERDTETAHQDVSAKVSDQSVPGLQDEQEDVLHGREAVEEAEEDEDSEEESGEGGGSEGVGYREDEE